MKSIHITENVSDLREKKTCRLKCGFIHSLTILSACYSVMCTKTGSWKYTNGLADLIWTCERKVHTGLTCGNRLHNLKETEPTYQQLHIILASHLLEPIYLNIKIIRKLIVCTLKGFFITFCLSGENNSWFVSHANSGDRCQPNGTEYSPIFILGKLKDDHMLCRRAWRLFDKIPLKWADSKVKVNWENFTWLICGKETISLTFHIIKMKVKSSFLKALQPVLGSL